MAVVKAKKMPGAACRQINEAQQPFWTPEMMGADYGLRRTPMLTLFGCCIKMLMANEWGWEQMDSGDHSRWIELKKTLKSFVFAAKKARG
jgi:hypothetical protein